MPMQSLARALLFVAMALPFSPARVAGKTRAVDWWIADSMEKIRPHDTQPSPPSRRAEIAAGRNEFQSFQIVLRADLEDIDGVDLDLSDFRTKHGELISNRNVTVYSEQYLNLSRPSSSEGAPGLWPDPLIPRIDRYANEKRNAFPLRLERGRSQALWIELYVPPSTVPGSYSGSVRILRDRVALFTAPIQVTVWAFTLPSTASLKSSFGLNGTTILKQHRGRYTEDADLYFLTRLYAKAALLHRISIHGGSMVTPKYSTEKGQVHLDWLLYDAEVGPFLDGTLLTPDEPLAGAAATTVELRTPAGLSAELQASYWQAWAKHFRKKGWYDRLFLYLWDEPTKQDVPAVLERGRAAVSADPTLRSLVTASSNDKLDPVVEIWAPLVNCLERRESDDFCGPAPTLETYARERRAGKSVWFYQSCASHGCNIVGGPYFKGWPSYMIDAGAVANRIMPWIAWKYQLDGELYYSMNEAYAAQRDPWTDVYRFGGNGDGTLFYPGTPERIGGRTDIPIESIRLKLIRAGMQDYDYLDLLAKIAGRGVADDFVSRMVQKPYQWESNPKVFLEIRKQLGDELNRLAVAAASRRADAS